MPNYVPGDRPTVPGHEAVVRVAKVGPGVERYKTGERFVVETDYRWLPTDKSNAAFGYNFEGGLQEYVLFDERVITSPEGESMLIPAPENLSASALALVEPWACVECAYAEAQRRTLKSGGRLLVASDAPVDRTVVERLPGRPSEVDFAVDGAVGEVADAAYDDIVYFGAAARTVETLFAKLAANGLMAIVQGGRKFGRHVNAHVGRVHYGGIRVIGTAGADPGGGLRRHPGDRRNTRGRSISTSSAPPGRWEPCTSFGSSASGTPGRDRLRRRSQRRASRWASRPRESRSRKGRGVALRCYNPVKDSLERGVRLRRRDGPRPRSGR